MSKIMEEAARAVKKRPDGKHDDAQPVQVMEDRELEYIEPFRFSIEEALELAVMKGDE